MARTATTINRVTGNPAFYGTVNLPNFELAGGSLNGTFTNTGTMNWSSGGISATMVNGPGGVLNLTGSGTKTWYGTFTNAGTVNWSGTGPVYGLSGFALNNQAGALFEIQGDATFNYGGFSPPVINNAGTLRKTGGSGTTSFSSTVVNNTGTVQAQSGTLSFNYGFTQTHGETRLSGGSLSGGTLDFTGGTLSGSGNINASVLNAAEVSPGASPGTITINGSYTQTSAGTLRIEIGGLALGSQHDQLVVNGPATLDGALQVSFTNGFVAGNGDFFNILSYASRSGGFASSSAGALGLTESYTPASLVLIDGSNAFPSLAFTVAGGNTQTVCVPFQLLATAADVDGAVTNLAVLLGGSAIANGNGAPLSPMVELDSPGAYTFIARTDDNAGGTSWATQAVTLVAYPLHWIISGGFRTNGAFKICMLGEAGRDYQVLANTNLSTTNWIPIGILESTNGIWRFFDTGATNHPYRFYRTEQLP